ncbi:MAG: hypothetical protein ACFCVF_07975 [Kineosporiaceae bacterium]
MIDLTAAERPRVAGALPVLPSWSAWPMPGRSALAAEISGLLAGPPGVGAVVVVAPRGVGRSAVARQVTALRDRAGQPTTWVVGTRYTRARPWGALRPLAPADAEEHPAAAVREALRQLPGPDSVVVVDDLHLVDPASADLLAELVVDGAVRVLATWPEDAGARDPLTAAAGSDLVAVRRLPALDAAAVSGLLRRTLDGEVSPDTATALTAAGQGNPRRVAEIVTRGLARGTLRMVGGLWTWDGDPGRPVRAAALPADPVLRRVVEVVAVADGAVGPDVVAEIAAAGDPAAVERAASLGLVRTVTSGLRQAVVPADPGTTDPVLEAMGDLRRRAVALELAARVDAYGGRRACDVLASALWQLEATGTAPREHLLRAVDHAQRGGDIVALEALTWAVLQGDPDPQVVARLAAALLDHGRFAEATALLGAVRTAADPGAAADLALVRARLHGDARQDHDRALSELDEVDERIGELRGDDARARGATLREARAWHRLWRSGPAAALAHIDVFARDAPAAAGLALALGGRSRAAAETASGHGPGSVAAGLARIVAACDDGWLDRAAALAAEAADDEAWTGSPGPRMWFALVAGRVALRRGWAAAATSWYTEAAALAEECGEPGGARLAAAGLTVSGAWHPAARRGMPMAGSPTAGPGVPRPRAGHETPPAVEVDERGGLLLVAEPVLATAWQAARDGDLDVAHRRLAAGHRTATERGSLSDAAWIGYGYVRLGRADLAVACLEPLRDRVDGSLLHAWLDHATAAAAGDPAALAVVGDRLAVCGAWLDAATALAQAAAVAREPERGAAWRAQARDYLARCGAWRSGPDPATVLVRA